MTSIIFFGTHHFAASILKSLIASQQYNIIGVITQPDRPVGRHQKMKPSPVKLLAEQYDFPIEQPESLRNTNLFTTLATNRPDLSLVCQYGLLIPSSIINLPKHGTINVHTSLLPLYRGASPIQSALMNGDQETGLSIMLIDDQMDHGPILAQQKISIGPDETAGELSERLAFQAGELLLDILPDYLNKKTQPQPQDHAQATFCQLLTREDGHLDWSKSELEIYNQYRGLTPWPGVWTTWNDQRMKLLQLKPNTTKVAPGLIQIAGGVLLIGTGSASVEVLSLQLEGKKVQTAHQFINGYANLLTNSKVS